MFGSSGALSASATRSQREASRQHGGVLHDEIFVLLTSVAYVDLADAVSDSKPVALGGTFAEFVGIGDNGTVVTLTIRRREGTRRYLQKSEQTARKSSIGMCSVWVYEDLVCHQGGRMSRRRHL